MLFNYIFLFKTESGLLLRDLEGQLHRQWRRYYPSITVLFVPDTVTHHVNQVKKTSSQQYYSIGHTNTVTLSMLYKIFVLLFLHPP